jgi:hypothetical protein
LQQFFSPVNIILVWMLFQENMRMFKLKKRISYFAAVGAFALSTGLIVSRDAHAVTIVGPVTQAQFQAFNGVGASYGAPL